MKYLLNVTLLVTIISASCQAKVTVLDTVLNAFKQKFPNAVKISWEKENAREYEANFIENNAALSANFNEEGKWMETESPLNFTALPEKVKAAFNGVHKGEKVKEVSRIEKANGTVIYEIEIKSGLKSVDILYNEDGSSAR